MSDFGFFIHVPKTGGNSIMRVLQKSNRRRNSRKIEIIGHNTRDSEFSFAKNRVELDSYPSFAFTRNPLDRVVSAYYYLKGGGNSKADANDAERIIRPYRDFEDFVMNSLELPDTQNQIHFRPQYQWICDDNGEVLVDYLGKFENLKDDFRRIALELRIRNTRLPHKNKSKRKRDYRTYYTEEMSKRVADIYYKDMEFFSYSQPNRRIVFPVSHKITPKFHSFGDLKNSESI